MTLDDLFDGDGLDQRLAEELEASQEGLEVEVVVTPATAEDDTQYHLLAKLSLQGVEAGELGLRWEEAEPKLMTFIMLSIRSPLRQLREPGALGARLIRFLHDELGIEELYAQEPTPATRQIGDLCGFRDTEAGYGGRIDDGPMRLYAVSRTSDPESL